MDTSPLIAVLDANVLYPRYVRDTLLWLAEAELYSARWSEEILEELRRNLVKDRATPEQVEWLLHEMRAGFPDANVSGYQAQIDTMRVDQKDRHVAAAAVVTHAQLIVTDNLRDFPQPALVPFGIEVLSADAFLGQLMRVDEERTLDVIKEQAAVYRKPPMTVLELIEILSKRLPMFADLVRAALTE